MKKRKPTPAAARHVRLYHSMLRTEAWRSLNGNERAIYAEMLVLYTGNNNGSIGFSARQVAQVMPISRVTASRALGVLQDRGFIVATAQGHFDRQRHATRWRLTAFQCDLTEQAATHDYAAWRTAEVTALGQTSGSKQEKPYG